LPTLKRKNVTVRIKIKNSAQILTAPDSNQSKESHTTYTNWEENYKAYTYTGFKLSGFRKYSLSYVWL